MNAPALPANPVSVPSECWGTCSDEFPYSDLEELISCADLKPGDVVFQGEPTITDPAEWVSAENVIERMSEAAWDEHDEWSEGYPEVSDEAKAILQTFLENWARMYCMPTFHGVANIMPYTITAEDLANG